MRRAVFGVSVVVALLSGGCGDHPSRPTPTPPVTPPVVTPPIQPAQLDVVRTSPMLFISFEPGRGWTFTGEATNTGRGCASNIQGSARFADTSGTTLQTVAFTYDPFKRVQPAETFPFQGCCLTEANGRVSGQVAVTFTWDNVSC